MNTQNKKTNNINTNKNNNNNNNKKKGIYCQHETRWYYCKKCSPSTAMAHQNRMYNRNLLLKPLEPSVYNLIEDVFETVLEKNDLLYLRKKHIPEEKWSIIQKEVFYDLKQILPNYRVINDKNNPIGCDRRFFKFNIQRQLKKDMVLDENENRKGIWDLDHIVPCCNYDLTELKHRKQCFNFKNFQPLLTKENQKKGGR